MMNLPGPSGTTIKRRVVFMKQVETESSASRLQRAKKKAEHSETGYVGFTIDLTDAVEADKESGITRPFTDDFLEYLRERWG